MNKTLKQNMFFNKHLIITIMFLITLGAASPAISSDEITRQDETTRRFGIFIGSNNGGRGRTTLRYAESDARSLSRVFGDMGGINSSDSFLLTQPTIAQINARLKQVSDLALQSKGSYKRTEVVFYYSGHSNEEGFLLDREQYSYKMLRENINAIPADMRIVVLDSCASGAFTRIKGGAKTQPFLFDSGSQASGHAFLTSSSATESSQESDTIRSSYFTHSLLAALRGAADTIGDGRVTLNEAYRFAYDQTLSKTENSLFGSQHPSYDIQISGSGDLVLTDVRSTSAGFLIDGTVAGILSIRGSDDFLVAEINKAEGKPMELGLEAGLYRLTLRQGGAVFRAEVVLEDGKRAVIGEADFRRIAVNDAIARGEDDAAWDTEAAEEASGDEEEGVRRVPFSFQILGNIGSGDFAQEKTVNNFLLGIFIAQGNNLNGISLASIGIFHDGRVSGWRGAGIFTLASNEVRGLQMAGVFNRAGGDLTGAQTAGLFNLADSDISGAQVAGVFNRAGGGVTGVQAAGLFNLAGGGISGAQIGGLFNLAGGNINGAQSGSQITGIFNWAGGTLTGSQIAGVFNRAGGDISGDLGTASWTGRGQVAGAVNWTDGGISGAQIAGLFNYSGGGFKGAQVAGLLNIAREKAEGAQVGLANIATGDDAAEKVYPVGLVNVIKGGMFHPVFYYDDMGFSNLSLKSGNKHFYSVLRLGTENVLNVLNNDDTFFIYSFGAGAEFTLGKFFIDLDISGGGIIDTNVWNSNGDDGESHYSSITETRLALGYKIFKHLGAFAGISFRFIWTPDETSPVPNNIGSLEWKSYDNIFRLGWFAGIQF